MPFEVESAKHVPLWVVFFSRLARFGKADMYSNPRNSRQLVRFNLDDNFRSKWFGLKDVEAIWIVYKREDQDDSPM